MVPSVLAGAEPAQRCSRASGPDLHAWPPPEWEVDPGHETVGSAGAI